MCSFDLERLLASAPSPKRFQTRPREEAGVRGLSRRSGGGKQEHENSCRGGGGGAGEREGGGNRNAWRPEAQANMAMRSSAPNKALLTLTFYLLLSLRGCK